MSLDKPYKDVPSTTIFDADMSRQGHHLNQFCMSLMKAENRARFKVNERAYLDEWPMRGPEAGRVGTRLQPLHCAAAGAALDLGKTGEAYWQPVFKGYEFSKQWGERAESGRDRPGLQQSRDRLHLIPCDWYGSRVQSS
jgi:protocatechuate 4,5-dioxygenase alpha subunit